MRRVMKWMMVCSCVALGCDAGSSAPPDPVQPAVLEHEVAATVEAPSGAVPVKAEPEAEAPEVDATPLSIVDVGPEAGPLAHQLKMHAKRGAESGQRVVLEMGAPWCPPCKRAKALLADEAVARALDGVVVLRADSDVWGEDLDALGFDAPVIPVYYLLDGEGGPSGESVRGDRWKSRAAVEQGLIGFLRG